MTADSEGGAPPPAAPGTMAVPGSAGPARRTGGFAGFRWTQLMGAAALLGAAVWGAWATRELMDLRARRIVAVSLAAMANDFVMAEARAGNSAVQTEADTRHYMGALQTVLQARANRGETILVGEAVVSSSVPDITADVRAAVGQLMTAQLRPHLSGPRLPAGPAPGSGAVPGAAPGDPDPSPLAPAFGRPGAVSLSSGQDGSPPALEKEVTP